jgi:DmX-like protein
LLTLDVLSKLPKYIEVEKETNEKENEEIEIKTFDEKDYSTPVKPQKADEFDWSNPISTSSRFAEEKLELDLAFSDDDDNEEELSESDKNETVVEEKVSKEIVKENPSESSLTEDKVVDLFAQQLKFIACLKVLIEEMSTLATGFEVTGGQLRYYMYYWLERETSILKDLSDYQCSICEKNLNMNEIDDISHNCTDTRGLLTNNFDDHNNDHEVHLHEQVIKDQKSFHEKIQRLNRRKLWLRSNELLLRTLLSYCSLHSAHGGGLASVRMELILLMQELIEDRGMKQLLSPLPLPTTIPLLTAIVVSSKTVVAGPIRLINGLINDILMTINDLSVVVPTIFDNAITISTIKELSVSLSACIYQCLCDSDAFSVPKNSVVTGMQGFCRFYFYKADF